MLRAAFPLTLLVLFGLFALSAPMPRALSQDAKKQDARKEDAKKDDKTPKKDAQAKPIVKKWKMTDLVPDEKTGLEGLASRSFERGKKLFTECKCIACHSYGDSGGFVGPNLSEVGGRFGPVDILSSIIEPNKVIADAYKQRIIEMEDGRVFTGMVIYMDDDVIIRPDMLDQERKITVNAEKILMNEESPVSPMPESLIDTLNREEILDLVAYVISRNDPTNEMFKK